MTSLVLDSAEAHAAAVSRTRSIPGGDYCGACQHDERGATAPSTSLHPPPQQRLRPLCCCLQKWSWTPHQRSCACNRPSSECQQHLKVACFAALLAKICISGVTSV
jgi:hypothetical protein